MEEIEESFKESSYCTTWGTAVVQIENPKISLKISLANNTIRQIVHVSVSGENIRLKLSNKSGETNLEIKEWKKKYYYTSRRRNIFRYNSLSFKSFIRNSNIYLFWRNTRKINRS